MNNIEYWRIELHNNYWIIIVQFFHFFVLKFNIIIWKLDIFTNIAEKFYFWGKVLKNSEIPKCLQSGPRVCKPPVYKLKAEKHSKLANQLRSFEKESRWKVSIFHFFFFIFFIQNYPCWFLSFKYCRKIFSKKWGRKKKNWEKWVWNIHSISQEKHLRYFLSLRIISYTLFIFIVLLVIISFYLF